ncbi:hypothetical protein MNBD_CHLOROFLEXI01-3129, partial [hydrothermal vent metagenome]
MALMAQIEKSELLKQVKTAVLA